MYIVLIIAWVCAEVCSLVASYKKRSAVLWFILGFITGPIALIYILLLKPRLLKKT